MPGNAQLHSACTELGEKAEQLPACCVPNSCLAAVTHTTGKRLENIVLEQWQKFPTRKMPLRRNYEAGSWRLNSPSALSRMGKELRQWSSRQCMGARQCSVPGQHNSVLASTNEYQLLLLLENHISSTFLTVIAWFDMCCCESFGCALCMGTEPTFSESQPA